MNGELHFNIQLLPSCGVNIESCQPEGDCFTKGFSAMESNTTHDNRKCVENPFFFQSSYVIIFCMSKIILLSSAKQTS
jgi:hypothetical protein